MEYTKIFGSTEGRNRSIITDGEITVSMETADYVEKDFKDIYGINLDEWFQKQAKLVMVHVQSIGVDRYFDISIEMNKKMVGDVLQLSMQTVVKENHWT